MVMLPAVVAAVVRFRMWQIINPAEGEEHLILVQVEEWLEL